jgi:hypothetical protein
MDLPPAGSGQDPRHEEAQRALPAAVFAQVGQVVGRVEEPDRVLRQVGRQQLRGILARGAGRSDPHATLEKAPELPGDPTRVALRPHALRDLHFEHDTPPSPPIS